MGILLNDVKQSGGCGGLTIAGGRVVVGPAKYEEPLNLAYNEGTSETATVKPPVITIGTKGDKNWRKKVLKI